MPKGRFSTNVWHLLKNNHFLCLLIIYQSIANVESIKNLKKSLKEEI